MNKDNALKFLQDNQPLPKDEVLEMLPEKIQKYNEAREYFLTNPDPICIPLFLNSFGDGSGFGTYQLVEDVLLNFSLQQVIPYLIESLNSSFKGVRYWSAQIALSFPHKDLIIPLKGLLSEEDSDIRFASLAALAEIEDKRVLKIIKKHKVVEEDDENLELIKEILDY